MPTQISIVGITFAKNLSVSAPVSLGLIWGLNWVEVGRGWALGVSGLKVWAQGLTIQQSQEHEVYTSLFYPVTVGFVISKEKRFF